MIPRGHIHTRRGELLSLVECDTLIPDESRGATMKGPDVQTPNFFQKHKVPFFFFVKLFIAFLLNRPDYNHP